NSGSPRRPVAILSRTHRSRCPRHSPGLSRAVGRPGDQGSPCRGGQGNEDVVGVKEQPSTTPRIWVLMSPHTGDNAQLRALTAALGVSVEEKHLAFRPVEWLPRIVLGATNITIDRA